MVPGGSDSYCASHGAGQTAQRNQCPPRILQVTVQLSRTSEGVGPMTRHSAFWEDLTRDLVDPEFQREYAAQSGLIAEVDAAIIAVGK